MPRFWLLKCEPDLYSIHDLARDARTGWDSVRNYQVRNFMRDDMRSGDLGIFYHSNAEPSGAAGVLKIVNPSVADPTQFDPKSDYHDPKSDPAAPTWLMCEVAFVEAFAEVVSLEAMRADPALAGMQILRRGNRLSITPLEPSEFERVVELGRTGARAVPPAKRGGKSQPKPQSKPQSKPKSKPSAQPSGRGGASRRAAKSL